MLVLMRGVGEKIIISDNIIITVLEINGRFVKLGIDAPKDIVILREEVRKKSPNNK